MNEFGPTEGMPTQEIASSKPEISFGGEDTKPKLSRLLIHMSSGNGEKNNPYKPRAVTSISDIIADTYDISIAKREYNATHRTGREGTGHDIHFIFREIPLRINSSCNLEYDGEEEGGISQTLQREIEFFQQHAEDFKQKREKEIEERKNRQKQPEQDSNNWLQRLLRKK